MRNVIIYLFLFSLYLSNLSAQTGNENNARFGLFGEYGLDQNLAEFGQLKNIPNCPTAFTGGGGSGLTFGALFEKPFNKFWGLNIRASYSSLSGNMSAVETTTFIDYTGSPNGNASPGNGEFNHTLNGKFSNVGLDPLVYFKILPNLQINLGLRAAMKLSATFDQKETVASSYGAFVDSASGATVGRTRNAYSGSIPDAAALNLYGLAGISYDLPMNSDFSWILSPSVFYYYNLNSMVSGINWKVNSLRIGLAVKYRKPEIEYEFKDIKKIDTVYIEKADIASNFARGQEKTRQEVSTIHDIQTTLNYYNRTDTVFTQKQFKLDGSLKVAGVDSLGNDHDAAQISIEEFFSDRLQPLLNYIFFDDNSDVMQEKYNKLTTQGTTNFQIKQLAKYGTLETYYEILNIIGRRMLEHPKAKLRIVGCNSGTGDELNNQALSQHRANTVKDYFENVWGLDDSRIKLESRNLPELPSTPIDQPDKIAENRRVELYSDDYDITAPVYISDTLRISDPPIARFFLKSNAEAGLKYWELKAHEKSSPKVNYETNGTSATPDSVDWHIDADQRITPNKAGIVEVNYDLTDNRNQTKSLSASLPIKYISIDLKRRSKQKDYEISKYDLILFDFDDYAIKDNNRKIIDFIKTKLKKNSDINITGYTDKTGDAQHNLKLSQNRALAAKNALNHNHSKSQGIGNTAPPFNNDIPEGRFYSRTVDITVETPITN